MLGINESRTIYARHWMNEGSFTIGQRLTRGMKRPSLGKGKTNHLITNDEWLPRAHASNVTFISTIVLTCFVQERIQALLCLHILFDA